MTRVTGFLPPIATPFLDGGLDLPSLQRLMEYLVDDVDGYLIGGSVGEVASLTLEERETLMRARRAGFGGTRSRLAVSISDNADRALAAPLGPRRRGRRRAR